MSGLRPNFYEYPKCIVISEDPVPASAGEPGFVRDDDYDDDDDDDDDELLCSSPRSSTLWQTKIAGWTMDPE